MKKILNISKAVLALTMVYNVSFAQTSVADGNWSDPATWGGTLPIGSGTVIINNNVTLDVDYAQTSGSITINASGELSGNSLSRGFALNYPSGTTTLTVDGLFMVARTLLYSGTITNSGNFSADSLLNNATLINNTSGVIQAVQCMNNTGGTITNNGAIYSQDFLNLGTVSNTGSLSVSDMTNSKSFNNTATGLMTIVNDFYNADTLASPAILTMDGRLTVGNDFQNGPSPATIEGSGSICVNNNSLNRGAMNGTFDFCDQTGGNIDLNTGTIASGITNCLQPCDVGIKELSENENLSIYPNPFSTQTTLHFDQHLNNATLTVVNYFGQTVKQIKSISGNTITLSRENLTSGIYFIRLTEGNRTIAIDKLVVTD